MPERSAFDSFRECSRNFGCGCILPGSGLLLVILVLVLAWAINSQTDGWSVQWLILVPLVAGIIALFVRIRWPRK